MTASGLLPGDLVLLRVRWVWDLAGEPMCIGGAVWGADPGASRALLCTVISEGELPMTAFEFTAGDRKRRRRYVVFVETGDIVIVAGEWLSRQGSV